MKRESGILYPISSLPSRFGIGSFSKEAYEFVDFLKEAGQSYWQVRKSLLYRSGKADRGRSPHMG